MVGRIGAAEYKLLVENSPVLVWRAGLDGQCDYFNGTWLAFTGRTLDQELGDGWTEGVHPDDVRPCVDLYLDHFRRRRPFEMEYRLRRHDGVYRYIFDRGVPFEDEHGQFGGFIGSCVDVDDRVRAQNERERHGEQQLAVAQNFEQWVLAIVGHDIRNPLTSIDACAQLIERTADPSSPAAVHSVRIQRGAARIKHLVDDLLDLSRARARGVPLSLEHTNLGDVCSEVLEELESAFGGRTVTFECSGDSSGTWDSHRIAQAVSNLVGNALQHSPPESPIDVHVHAEADPVTIEVHNDGEIAPDVLPLLFSPFRGGKQGRPGPSDGLGLGLFIADAIARAHDGTIHVESSPQRGTTFSLTLPRRHDRRRNLG